MITCVENGYITAALSLPFRNCNYIAPYTIEAGRKLTHKKPKAQHVSPSRSASSYNANNSSFAARMASALSEANRTGKEKSIRQQFLGME